MSGQGYHAGNLSNVAAETPGAFGDGRSEGYTRQTLIDHTHGAVHTSLSVHTLAPGGRINPHFHSTEEGLLILEGEVVAALDGHHYTLGASDFAASRVGQIHALRNVSDAPVRWLEMRSPQPLRSDAEYDVFHQEGEAPTSGARVAPGDPRSQLVGHFDVSQLMQVNPVGGMGPDAPDPRLGPRRKMLIDRVAGLEHLNMFVIQFEPGGGVSSHDHPFEESYFMLAGETEVELGDETYSFKVGDFGWAAVNAPHGFINKSDKPVRWLETAAPQPPPQGRRRIMAAWEETAREFGTK
jgi:quercetin dioxygenase-like cupin family protein